MDALIENIQETFFANIFNWNWSKSIIDVRDIFKKQVHNSLIMFIVTTRVPDPTAKDLRQRLYVETLLTYDSTAELTKCRLYGGCLIRKLSAIWTETN